MQTNLGETSTKFMRLQVGRRPRWVSDKRKLAVFDLLNRSNKFMLPDRPGERVRQ